MRSSPIRYHRENLCSVVVEYIKEKILTGQYERGERILETEVAQALGISRAPVREGIKELDNEGIVTIVPRKGTFVSKFTLEDIKEVFDIRLLLENNIIEILINEERLNDKDFITLENIVQEMINVVNTPGDMTKKSLMLNERDVDFHRYIWNKSGSKRRVEILEKMHFQLRMAMLYDTKETGDLLVTAIDHYEIIKHLKNKDLENCKKALKEHIISYKKGRF